MKTIAAIILALAAAACGDNVETPDATQPVDAGTPDADLTDANCFTILRTCHCTADGLEDCGVTQQWDCGCYPPEDAGL